MLASASLSLPHRVALTSCLRQLEQLSIAAPAALPSVQQIRHHLKGPHNSPNYKVHAFRRGSRKHFDPKWKKERADKVIKVDLPDFHESTDGLTPQEIRMKLKLKGIAPFRPWQERPMLMASTAGVFEPYIPPEGEGKQSIVSKEGAKQKLTVMEKKGKSYMAVRKIRRFDEDFDVKEFADEAQKIYIDAHTALANEDEDLLHDLVTEKAYPLMTHETKLKTIRWQFLETLEPPRVVHARCTNLVSDENIYAQVTVRFHTKQTLAVYDRFGRLMHGSEVVGKDVLEYVVFEKHVANTYGIWRLHEKLVPDWAPPLESGRRTFRLKPEESPKDTEAAAGSGGQEPTPPPPPAGGDPPSPQMATA